VGLLKIPDNLKRGFYDTLAKKPDKT